MSEEVGRRRGDETRLRLLQAHGGDARAEVPARADGGQRKRAGRGLRHTTAADTVANGQPDSLAATVRGLVATVAAGKAAELELAAIRKELSA